VSELKLRHSKERIGLGRGTLDAGKMPALPRGKRIGTEFARERRGNGEETERKGKTKKKRVSGVRS